ncbi:MAG: carbon-nitrogen family hydrolase [Planctomycetes bacterium]|nr:carbon-nitrogen family hydrolase [Planctomycetota bacterium]
MPTPALDDGSATEPEDFVAACVQFDVRQGDVAANLTAVRDGITEAIAAGATLVVLPELWATSFLAEYDAATLAEAAAAEREVRELSAQHGLCVIGSNVEASGDHLHNTVQIYDHGRWLGAYRKLHLFSPNLEDRRLSPGDQPLVVDTSCGRLGVLVCYDLRFPELARYYFHCGVEILTVPGQWPEARAQHWRTLLRARAIEDQMFVLGCNRTGQEPSQRNGEPMAFPGDSRIVDPTGEVLAAGAGAAGVILAPIELRKARTVRRILPVARDQRPKVYRALFEAAWPRMVEASREDAEPGATS